MHGTSAVSIILATIYMVMAKMGFHLVHIPFLDAAAKYIVCFLVTSISQRARSIAVSTNSCVIRGDLPKLTDGTSGTKISVFIQNSCMIMHTATCKFVVVSAWALDFNHRDYAYVMVSTCTSLQSEISCLSIIMLSWKHFTSILCFFRSSNCNYY